MSGISPIPQLTQRQREAIFDLLLLGMYADSSIKLSENQGIYELIAPLGWESYQDPREYSELATARVREASENPDKTKDFLVKIADRLELDDAKQFALVTLMRLNEVDKTESPEEGALYLQAKAIFGVD